MEAIECIRTRRSIRKFSSRPVPKETLIELVETARQAPSYRNCQPWELVILSGKKREVLSDLLIHLVEKGVGFNPDIPFPAVWPDPIQRRMDAYFKKRAERLKIKPDDPDVMKHALIENFTFYGAPHVIFLFQDRMLSEWQILDAGMFAQSLMLAAHARGVGTVPQAYLTYYSEEVKNFLEIPSSKRLLLGISTGYAEVTLQTSAFPSERVPASEWTRWVE